MFSEGVSEGYDEVVDSYEMVFVNAIIHLVLLKEQ